ncbi:hypothetical protein CHISP_3117 [Chitinispirillum alkaliphilum]|nr:hypothetical protein CHISP_3117 [Chitinispirillum alkaliphilum]
MQQYKQDRYMHINRVIPINTSVLLLLLLFCNSTPANTTTLPDPDIFKNSQRASIEIREIQEHQEFVRVARGDAEELNQEVIKEHLTRLEPVYEDQTEYEFSMPKKRKRIPRSGITVKGEFPSKEDLAPPTVLEIENNEPLSVLRIAPEGDVRIAPHVSLTFSRPMVAVTSQSEAAEEVPVTLRPQPEGSWRWINTQTLIFEPQDGSLPKATEYQVTINEDATCIDGERISGERLFTFRTQSLRISRSYPSGSGNRTNAPIFIGFDQRIDQKSILNKIDVSARGQSISFKSGNPDELSEEFRHIHSLIANAGEGCWILLFLDKELPPATEVRVTVAKGAQSLEGTLETSVNQSFIFFTYSPLVISRRNCRGNSRCRPGQEWFFNLNNSLDTENFDTSMIRISPAVDEVDISASQTGITIRSRRVIPNTVYTIEFSREIRDLFGQNLSGDTVFNISVGNNRPVFYAQKPNMSILDPAASPAFRVITRNYKKLSVRVWRVNPSDWNCYASIPRYQYSESDTSYLRRMPGKIVLNDTLTIRGKHNELVETRLDLCEYLSEGKGHLIVSVIPAQYMEVVYPHEQRSMMYRTATWLQVTNIGLDAWTDPNRLLVKTTSLDEGKPLSDVKILRDTLLIGKTVSDGFADLHHPSYHGRILKAVLDKDTAFIPMYQRRQQSHDQGIIHAFDDRGIYRPGEEVHIKGWLRRISQQVDGDIELISNSSNLSYTVKDSRYNQIANGTVPLSELGGFDFNFPIPPTSNLGYASVQLKIGNFFHSHLLKIQEFRRPEFEVKTNVSAGPHFTGEEISATVTGSYYTGGSLAGAETTWSLNARTSRYTPPNWRQYSFGKQIPWFWHWHSPSSHSRSVARNSFTGETDISGTHAIKIQTESGTPPGPLTLELEASVTDVNRQKWTSKTSTLIHPATYYVGLKTNSFYSEPGRQKEIELIVTDVEGEIIEGVPVIIKAQRVRMGRNSEPEMYEDLLYSQAQPSSWNFTPASGGIWRISAALIDKQGRHNYTSILRWVRSNQIISQNKVEMQDVLIFPDKDFYAPGDSARLLIQAPFAPSEGVLLLERFGIVEEKRFSLSKTSKEFTIPIIEGYTPNLHVQVHISGVMPRFSEDGQPDSTLPVQPALANGKINLSIPPHHRKLEVTAKPQKYQLSPGESTSVSVQINDQNGNAVQGAEVAVVVVDEAILSLTDYKTYNPMEVFYRTRPSMVSGFHNRPWVVLADLDHQIIDEEVNEAIEQEIRDKMTPRRTFLFDGADAPETEASSETFVRTDFNPLAAFHPAGYTDSTGMLEIQFKLPDNLTRYRVMVVAADGAKRFGTAESNMTARLPLMVRPSPPRFLNYGDSFELPVILQNLTEDKLTVEVVSRAQNMELKVQGYRVEVPENDRVEVRFPASTISAGEAHFQVMAVTDELTDAAAFSLPVWTPATTEAFATYGTIDQGAVSHLVKRPQDVWPQFGGVQISTSSTALLALTDPFLFLYRYSFPSSESMASRIISMTALRDVIHEFNIPNIPSLQEIEKRMYSDIQELESRQNADGGFGFWRPQQVSSPFISLHTIHALTRAELKGYETNERQKILSNSYLRNIDRHISADYNPWTRRTIIAYSLYVRALRGDFDESRARSLLEKAPVEEWNIESLGWILYALSGSPESEEVKQIISHLHNRVDETANTAQFTQCLKEHGHRLVFHSAIRSNAVALEALMKVRPQSDLIIKLVRGLLADRTAGRWRNTQENGFVLLALDTYFNEYESQMPNFTTQTWLGNQYAGDHSFRGRTTETHQINVPMHHLLDMDTSQNLVLLKEGQGRMYYRIGMDYAPVNLMLEPANHGFHVERSYRGVDNEDDVVLRDDGVYEIRTGSRVRVTVRMVAPGQRYNVALVDPLPAGLEVLYPAFVETEEVPWHGTLLFCRWFSGPWYEHQNMRDERVEVFSSFLWGRDHEYVYYARATTPGDFIVPPAKAEDMYAPEIFGRSGTDRVLIRE